MIPLKLTTRNDQGPALLLIHGFPLDHRIWLNQIEKLPYSLRLVVPDLRGHGASPPAPAGSTTTPATC
jgi:pimeloyl-ACP methyl ester carboxylesterase